MKRTLLVILTVATLLVGCATASAEPRPPTIHYGEDVSIGCGMIISDERFAVGALPEDGGNPLLFDDVGDFLDYAQSHLPHLRAVFVHDYQTRDWLRAENTWFLLSPEIQTPMNSGIAAFSQKSSAEQMQAERGGQILSWSDLIRTHLPSQTASPIASHVHQ